jgi:hypothetical protein
MKAGEAVLRMFLLAALGAALLVAAPAGADEAKPQPCNGVAITDPDTDGRAGVALNMNTGLVAPAANLDITQVFFTTRADGEGVLRTTAHIAIKNLTKTAPLTVPPGELSYWVYWDDPGDGSLGARAAVASDGTVSYSMTRWVAESEVPALGPLVIEDVPTTGSYVPGENGVVSIDLAGPAAAVATELTGVYADTGIIRHPTEYWIYPQSDRAPDAGATTVKQAACPAAGATPTATPTSAPRPEGQPADPPAHDPEPTPTPYQAPADPGYETRDSRRADGTQENVQLSAPAAKRKKAADRKRRCAKKPAAKRSAMRAGAKKRCTADRKPAKKTAPARR